MNSNKEEKNRIKFTDLFILITASYLLSVSIFMFYIIDTNILFEYGFFSLTITGIVGILGIGILGLFLSRKSVNQGEKQLKHFSFAITLSIYSFVGYVMGLSIYNVALELIF